MRTLEAAEREAVAATEKLLKAQAKIEQLKAKAKGKGGKDKGGLPASPSLASLGEGGEAAIEALQERIAALKASRDKLIGAFDAQAAEIERLSGDNAALAEVGLLAGEGWSSMGLAGYSKQQALVYQHWCCGMQRASGWVVHQLCAVGRCMCAAFAWSYSCSSFFSSHSLPYVLNPAHTAAPLQSLAELRDTASKWEAQAQASLAQNERLKDLLEESATWSIPAAHGSTSVPGGGSNGGGSMAAAAAVQAAEALAAAAAAGSPRAGEGGGSGGPAAGAAAKDGSSLAELCRKFERELLLEKARSAQLDLQVRWGALCGCCWECGVGLRKRGAGELCMDPVVHGACGCLGATWHIQHGRAGQRATAQSSSSRNPPLNTWFALPPACLPAGRCAWS